MLLLAGCASAAPPGAAVVRVAPRPGVEAPPARGETQLVVRAVSAAAPGQEVAGASCEAVSPYFAARFTPPARVLLPDYGSRAPEVTVTCRAGELSGAAAAAPQLAWSGGMGGWPAVGVSVGTGDISGVGVGFGWWGGGVGGSYGEPVVRYPALRVPMQ
jgi:hypothetical protein